MLYLATVALSIEKQRHRTNVGGSCHKAPTAKQKLNNVGTHSFWTLA